MKHLSPILLATALSIPLGAQSLAEGYAADLRALPVAAGEVWSLGTAGTAWFNGTRLVLDDGASQRVLLTLPASVFGSFTIQVSPTELLFGESSNGEIWLVPFSGSAGPRRLTTLAFNYDAVPFGGTHALVSAKTGGFSTPDNDIIAVDLATGATDPIARIPGASGPVALDAAGNLLYATSSLAFPPPPAGTDVLRFDAGKIASAFGPGLLTTADAAIVHTGLDAAGSIALDGDGDLFVVDWVNDQVLEIDDLGSGSAAHVLADYTGAAVSAGTVQVVPVGSGPSRARFEPFQPAGAAVLAIHESQFGSASQLRSVRPERALTSAPAQVGMGPFTITTRGGPAGGTALLALDAAALAGNEVGIALGGFEQPLFWSFARHPAALAIPLSFDATGVTSLALTNPGVGQPLALQVQVGFVDAAGRVLGSAAPAVLTLQ